MVSVRIGNDEKKIDRIDSEWIHQQINNRRHAGEAVCVQVLVNFNAINIALTTECCPKGQFVERRVSEQESEIFDLWERMGLKDPNFRSSTLVDFLLKLLDFK